MKLTRRGTLQGLLAGGGAASGVATNAAAATCDTPLPAALWRRGIEGQRRADLGDGRFLNPVLSGDHPDPSVVREGAKYYLTCSSFDAQPGLVIWESADLVNWRPLTAALQSYVGSVWAPELCRHGSRYYIYFHARTPTRRDIYAIHAERAAGPWSEPQSLGLPAHIDPGHVAGEDGRRYLFLSGVDRVRLSDDGLRVDGPVEHVYDAWRYPDDWDVESFSPEGPKLLRRGEWFYLITAVGGTAGPPTGHMVIAARSRSIHGPWEHAPHNPLVRTRSAREQWWSRGHATLIDTPDGSDWLLLHGYEKGFHTLGRQTLLAPVVWKRDGWFHAGGGDLSQPIASPRAAAGGVHGIALSDDFSSRKLGLQWAFHDPAADEASRLRFDGDGLVLAGKGNTPADCSPLCCIVGDHRYRMSVDIEIDSLARAGLLLFYNRRLYCGLGFDADGFVMHRYGLERRQAAPVALARSLSLRVTNDNHIVTIHYRIGSGVWQKFGVQMEVSGYHHNVAYDFLSLRPAIYAAGSGNVRFRQVRYEALPEATTGMNA